MSEENAPKLRLKPKLAVDPVVPPPPLPGAVPAAETPPPIPPLPSAPPPPKADEAKSVPLKPKLSPAQSGESFPPPPKSSAPPTTPVTPASAESEKQGFKFNLKPKEVVESAPPVFLPPTPATLDAPVESPPIPAPEYVEPDTQTFPAELLAHKPVTAKPFPPPPGNFPPPPGANTKPAPPWAKMSSGKPAVSKKKKIVVWGGFVVVLFLALGGAFFAYQKFTAPPQAPVIAKKPVAETPVVVAPAPSSADATQEAKTAAVESKPVEVAPVPQPEPIEVAPPPPPASVPFKAWVENLRVGGVRTGATTRVFIGGTAYEIGDLVNPQLGIYFHAYNVETRKLTFRDKTGALVEKRN